MPNPNRGMNNGRPTNTGPVKIQDKKGTIIRIGKYLFRFKGLILLAIILSLVSNVLSLLGPKLSGLAISGIEDGIGSVHFDVVYHYAFLMLICFVFSSAMAYILSILMIKISQKVVYQMRQDVFNSLSRLPVSYFDTHQAGDIISHISYDIDTVNTSLSSDLVQIVTSVITVVGSLIMMITIAPVLVLVFVFTVPLSILLTRYMTGKTRPLFRKRSQALGIMNGYVEEMFSGHRTLKAYNREKTATDRFDVKNEDAVGAYYNAEYYGSMVGPSVNFINNLSLALITVFGALVYINGKISLGDISSFVLYSRKFSGPINEAANIISEFQSAIAAAERVFRVIDEPCETLDVDNAKVLSDVKGDVSLKDVSFGYTKEKLVLKDVNIDAMAGKMVAIVGPTGSGKTTIINLLMRFYDADKGVITVDENDITKVTRDSLRHSYAMVLQDTWLFKGTVFENIAYGKPDATMEEVEKVAKAARIHDYIIHLPERYNTIIEEEGMNISKGQKQLLTIARAMLLDSKMLILDEATSNVDTRTEMKIQEAMRTLMKDKTCFVIAHRLSTIKNADVILVVKDGNVIEQGTHEELLGSKGFYAKMFYSQFD